MRHPPLLPTLLSGMGAPGPSREQTAFAKGLYLCWQETLKVQKAAREICAVKIKAAIIKQEFPLSQGGGREEAVGRAVFLSGDMRLRPTRAHVHAPARGTAYAEGENSSHSMACCTNPTAVAGSGGRVTTAPAYECILRTLILLFQVHPHPATQNLFSLCSKLKKSSRKKKKKRQLLKHFPV